MLVKYWKQSKCSSIIKFLNTYTHIVILFRNENEKKVELHTKRDKWSERTQIHHVNTVWLYLHKLQTGKNLSVVL